MLADKTDAASPLPVLVVIHCESYETGTGNAYDGTVMAAQMRVMVITINFRLGPLGEWGKVRAG